MNAGLAAPTDVRVTRNPVVLLLATVLFINYVDRGALPTAAHLIQSDLRLTDSQLGLLMSAFFWTYATVQIPVGWLAERYGAQRVLAAGLALWGLATMLVGFSHGYPTLLALRLLLGIGESTGFPCVSKLLVGIVPLESLGTANGMVAFAYLLGPAAGAFIGGLMMAGYGWRLTFVAFGALSLLWLWPWARYAPAAQARWQGGQTLSSFAALLRQRGLWGSALGHFSSNYTYYFMLSWLPFYLVRERGFSTTDMAQLAGGAYLLNALCAVTAGRCIDRFIGAGGSPNSGYKSIMIAAHLGAVACMLGMALGPRSLALGCMFVYQALCGAASPGVFAVAQILAGPSATGRWVGIQNTVGNFAGILAPALTGALIERSGHFTGAFVWAAAMSLLGVFGWVFLVPDLGKAHRAHSEFSRRSRE